jgi:immune inhibitor A
VRLVAPLIGACLLLLPQAANAAPPVRPSAPDRAVSRAAGRLLDDARARGLDRAEAPRATGAVGGFRAVVILLQFPDWPADTLNHPPSAYDSLLSTVGVIPTGSLRDYYREVSRGLFDFDSIYVTRWYTAPHPYSYYAAGQSGFGVWPNNAQQMAADAVALADPDVDFSRFDSDGPDGVPHSPDDDGVVDGLFVVHAGPGGEETALGSDIHSHKWRLRFADLRDGVTIYPYTSEPEEWAGLVGPATPGQLISVGVFCHEFGHVLGLPDLYDTDPAPTGSEGIGEWDLMGTGVYTHPLGAPLGATPAHLSAWSRLRLGWAQAVWVLQDSMGVTIPPVETSGTVFRLWTNGLDEGEYFLLENRQPIGFDSTLVQNSINHGEGPAHGLLIYHVDDRVPGNDEPDHKMIDVEEAGGPEGLVGTPGTQNLDLEAGQIASQAVCGQTPNVVGNRGDQFDPWPGALGLTSFDSNTCPGSHSYCGAATQVAVRNIAEVGGDIVADFYVRGVTIRRLALLVDDSPSITPANNGNGRPEAGETVGLQFPIRNLDPAPTDPLYAKVRSRDFFTGLIGDSIDYGVIAGAATDSGTVLLAGINAAPDPRGALFAIAIQSPAGLVQEDSVQILIGARTGLCDTFESTTNLWLSIPSRCGSVSEWHREAGVNHTTGGTWAWRLGPAGLIGCYAPSEDARLVSQPIRLEGSGDTLVFWQRYDTFFDASDGLSVEASRDGGVTWTELQPVGGYPNGSWFWGYEPTFQRVQVPLDGYAGLTQIAFRFRSQPPTCGLGWWIDDVRVTGTAECATTAVAIARFDAVPAPSGAGIQLQWKIEDAGGGRITIDRALAGGTRARLVQLTPEEAPGGYLDRDVIPGESYDYWLLASRPGEPAASWGPVRAVAPAGVAPAFLLSSIRPNPFNPTATVTVSLDRAGPFVLRVYRADGTRVRTLARAIGGPGILHFRWDGKDEKGAAAGSGLYLFQLRSGQRSRVTKAVLLR